MSRIIKQAREIAALPSAQVLLSSHSPAILSRIEPEEVRYFRKNQDNRCSTIRELILPKEEADASAYVRLAVKAYPELYFARFVILGEGDSERFVIPKIAEKMGISLDPSFVPVIPLGGRFVTHFWRLLNDLEIPYATLLDLDLGRQHGGTKVIRDCLSNLACIGANVDKDKNTLDHLTDQVLLNDGPSSPWLKELGTKGIFFSYPIDLDFAMLRAFPIAYQVPNPGGKGPKKDGNAIKNKKNTTLKTGGNPALYSTDYDNAFIWYPYLFLSRSKPETHLAAFSRIGCDVIASAPRELIELIEYVKEKLNL